MGPNYTQGEREGGQVHKFSEFPLVWNLFLVKREPLFWSLFLPVFDLILSLFTDDDCLGLGLGLGLAY